MLPAVDLVTDLLLLLVADGFDGVRLIPDATAGLQVHYALSNSCE